MGKTLKTRNMMYTQQIQCCQYKDNDSLYSAIENKLNPDRFALITHDKDIDDTGKPKAPHFHAMLAFGNARSVNSIAKLLGDKEQYIEIWNNKASNGFAYLTHRTEQAKDKHQYDPAEVKANFDYPAELAKITQQVAKANPRGKSDELLDGLYDGTYNKEDVESRMTGSQYGKTCKMIENIEAKRLQREAEEFRKNMTESGTPLLVAWLYGKTATGKTSAATEKAEQKGQPYYITGSSRDLFQSYKGEHTIIMDEFRPGIIAYSDLLRILDPYGTAPMAPSRYHDKYLACDLIIITSPYSPIEYYCKEFGAEKGDSNREDVDSFEQLLRRISLTVYMTEKKIYRADYDKAKHEYVMRRKTAKPNTYSKSARQGSSSIPNAVNLFEKLFH